MPPPLLDEGEDVTELFRQPSADEGEDVTAMFSVPSMNDGEDVTSQFNASAKPSAPDTSFSSAIKQGIDAPLEAIGTTAQVFGATKIGKALKDLTEAPVNYESASERFGKPKEGDFTIAGFAPAQIPRALTEQFGQITGSLISRVAGGIIGGVITGGAGAAGGSAIPVAGTAAGGLGGLGTGAVVGQFAGPFLFGALQIAGPTALERAKRNGRTDPNGEDIAAALVTAAGSGSLDAIGAQYLPGGKKLVGSFVNRLAGAFYGESVTEAMQSVAEQTGESLGTKEGLKVSLKQAFGEGMIGGISGSGATAISEPFRPADTTLVKTAPSTAAAVARTQPVTVTVPEVAPQTTPKRERTSAEIAYDEMAGISGTLPSGSLGPPDPIVVEAEAAGAPQTAAALNQTMPPKPFAPRIEEPGTPTPYGRGTDVFDVTAGLQRAPTAQASSPVAGKPVEQMTPKEYSEAALPTEYVSGVAVKDAAGTVRTGQIHALIEGNGETGSVDGYVTNTGRFVTREEADVLPRKSIGMSERGDVTAEEMQDPFRRLSLLEKEMASATNSQEREIAQSQIDSTLNEINSMGYTKRGDTWYPPEKPLASPAPESPVAATEATAQKMPWEMTRWDYAESAKPNKMPPEFDALDALAKRSNRSLYNPDAITEKLMQEFKANGWVSGTKNFKLTESGRNKLDDWRRDVRENDLSAGNASDMHIEHVEQALREGKPVPESVLADYPDLKPTPAAPAAKVVETDAEKAIRRRKFSTPKELERGDAAALQDKDAYVASVVARLKERGADKLETQTWKNEANTSHRHHVEIAIAGNKPVSAAAVAAYGIKLPEGWTQRGNLWHPPEAKPAPAAPEPAPVASIKVGDTITAKSHQITGLTHTGKVVSVQGDEIGMVNQDNAPVLVLKKNVENTEPAPAPSRIQLRSGPATYSVVEQLAPQKGDQPGETYFRVKNEQTGEEQTVEAADMKPVKAKGAKAVVKSPVPKKPSPPPSPTKTDPESKLRDKRREQEVQDLADIQRQLDEAEPSARREIQAERDTILRRLRTFDEMAFGRAGQTAGIQWTDSPEFAAAEALRENPNLTWAEAVAEGSKARKIALENLVSDKMPVPEQAVNESAIELPAGYELVNGEFVFEPETGNKPWSPVDEAKTMRRKLRGSESGAIPASLFADIADFGARIYRDGMSFARWSADMVRYLGERVRSALKELWVGMLNPKGARNLRGEVIQKRDQGGAIGAAGGRAEPKPGAPVEGGREGEYYTRVGQRDQGIFSNEAFKALRGMTTVPDEYKADMATAESILDRVRDEDGNIDLLAALNMAEGMSRGIYDIFSEATARQRVAMFALITQSAAKAKDAASKAKNLIARKFFLDIEVKSLASLKDELSQGGKVLNMGRQIYANMPKSADAQVMSDEELLHRMTGGKAAEVEAAQAKVTLKTALDEQLKGMDESIRDIMRTKPKSSWDEIRQRIADEVVAKMNLATEAERKAATDKIIADLKKRMEKVRKELLAKMSKPGKPGNKTALDKLWKLWELGALDDDALTKVFMEKAGVKEFTPAFRDKLKKMYEGAETAPEGMPRERILGNIAVELALANPKTFGFWWNLAMSISYGNILGAFTTIFVNNPLGSLATSLEMVAMGSLSNKGARAETFKGAVKTWARSLGDGVAMMRDLWSTGENLQKISQFDSALVNSPVELLAKMAEDPSYPKAFRAAAKAVSQYKWIMRSMMAADAVIRWPAREALRFTQSAAIAKDTRRPGQSLEDAVDELNYPGGRPAAVREARTQAAKERKDGTLKTKLDERLRVIQLLQSKLSAEGTEAATESDELANYGSLLNDQPQDFIGVIASAILKIAFPSNTKTDIQKALGGAAQPFVRFVRTSANATRVMLDYSIGYGAFRYMTRNWPVIGAESLAGGANLVEGRAGDRLTQVRIQRAYLGIALYAGLAAIYAAIDDDDEDPYIDFIGSGPTTPDERRRVRESGVRFNSIKIGDNYFPTNVGMLQPLAGNIAPFQRMRDNKKWPKGTSDIVGEKVPELAGVAVAKGIADAVMNQSFTRSLADLLTIINTGKTSFGEDKWEFAGKNVAQFIPGNLRGLSQLDEIVRGKKERADGFFDTATNAIAFYAPNGRATTILGDEVDAGKSVAQKAGEKVFQFTTLADDKTLQFVVKNGLSIPDRQPKPSDGKRQTYPEYSEYMRESGKMMRNWLETKNPETGKTGMEMLQSIPDEAPGKNGRPTNPRRKAMNELWVKFRRVALMKQ